MENIFPLFQKFPQLKEKMPVISLGTYPTPVHKLENIGKHFQHDQIWIKRDDKSSEIYSGNKVRMFEFILGYAKALQRKTLLSWGSIGSNQILASVVHAQNMDFDRIVTMMFKQPVNPHVLQNMLVDFNLGAQMHYCGGIPRFGISVMAAYAYLKITGKKPFLIPYLGSSVPSVLGYVSAVMELKEQIDRGEMPEPDVIFVTVGTGGTFAGIELGTKMAGLKSKVTGTRITDKIVCNESMVRFELNRTLKFLRQNHCHPLPLHKYKTSFISMDHTKAGKGYGEPTSSGLEAIQMMKEKENIILDQTYTGKTFASVLDYLRKPEAKDKVVLYWHTLNSVDLSKIALPKEDYKQLPEAFHPFFEAMDFIGQQ